MVAPRVVAGWSLESREGGGTEEYGGAEEHGEAGFLIGGGRSKEWRNMGRRGNTGAGGRGGVIDHRGCWSWGVLCSLRNRTGAI